MTGEQAEDATAHDGAPDPTESEGGAESDDAEAASGEGTTGTAGDVVDPTDDEGPILLFDGVCNLCTGVVQFLIPRDPEGKLRYGSLQSDAGQHLLERFGLPTDSLDTFVLVEGERCYTRSTAALRVAKHLGRPYSWLYPLRYVPRPVRDAVYGLVARYRYRVFGKKDQCMLPPPDWESRFIE